MHLSETKLAILRELRHGANTLPVLADATELPPFTANAELKDLKRARLVTDGFYPEGHLWELTVTGCGLAWSSAQVELEAGRAW